MHTILTDSLTCIYITPTLNEISRHLDILLPFSILSRLSSHPYPQFLIHIHPPSQKSNSPRKLSTSTPPPCTRSAKSRRPMLVKTRRNVSKRFVL